MVVHIVKRRKPSHIQSIGLVRTNLLCKIGRGIDENVFYIIFALTK